MRILQVKPYLTDNELKNLMSQQTDISAFRDYQIVYFVQTNFGKKAGEIAKELGVTTNKVYKTIEKYNKLGLDWKKYIPRGGRREARCIMWLEEEASFLKSMEAEALKGQIITHQQIKSRLELLIHRTVSDDYIWDLFKRHGWRKKVPRKSHPKADRQAQEEYKKNFLNCWQPNR